MSDGTVTGRPNQITEPSPAPPAPSRPPAPPLTPLEAGRWMWRQLTSMRTALLLLFLLAVAAIPGSIIPQRGVNPLAVADFAKANPELASWYDRFSLFDVYSSPWFAAIYLALVVSLLGCIVPRARLHWRAMRARPPAAPRVLSRMPEHRVLVVPVNPADALRAAAAVLRSRRYRINPGADHVAGERGYLRETGNLVFHLSVVIVLLAVAVGSLFGYRAAVLVVEGSGFANSVIQYDSLQAGTMFDPARLPPFTLRLDTFEMDFVDDGPQVGSPAEFVADVELTRRPGEAAEKRTLRVNHPLDVDGTLVHLINPGYAPEITVRNGAGKIIFSGAVPFLPQDNNFASSGVVKIEIPPGEGEDIGIEGLFLPTATLGRNGPQSVFPEARNPALFFTAYHGDLGLDGGMPQSVYRLDKAKMTQFVSPDGEPYREGLSVGQTAQLPNGAGSVTFDGYSTWVNFQVGRNAGKEWVLAGAVLMVLGILASLFVRRRRAWVRVTTGEDGRTVVEVAGLDRSEGGGLDVEIDEVTKALAAALGGEAVAAEGRQEEGT